ncbi:adenosylcobinamide-phosphate synthase CbiB [Celeribacter indicus]|uniref:Cobalamin biosynthesis protein CobD n=1 Tax=Celeribacter indicus TaxID=1208324 RepID=A0A0B5DQ91_9RHOB|nr:adenosylcobinamide-phosphate synthase CbiB [Celeribacter indicus]AJE45299.1 cobalamin biosynthesis protein [Celeribacter indicus]SDX20473.1 adenosylcobinamide-phosphate synthase [Celeribacter indicus]
MSTACLLALAMALDAVLGEPGWLWSRVPHPAVLLGRLIGRADRALNRGRGRKAKGVALVAGLVLGSAALGLILARFPSLEVIGAAILLAHKSLIEHVRAVARALELSLAEGRAAVAMIVGRDTTEMDGDAVARAAIESAAENFSDGVIAPAFWFLLFGLPGMLVYKAVNTADSMIGYRTERHRDFGWAAARLDDLLNLVPARLTALLLFPWSRPPSLWRGIVAEARRHRSPNAGWPEAALSRSLGLALSGPRSYDGVRTEYPWVNPEGRRSLTPHDIDAACVRLWVAWAVCLTLLVILSFA